MAQMGLVVEIPLPALDLWEFGNPQRTSLGRILELYKFVEAADVFKYAFADVCI